jgi:hypothetical protein
VQGAKSKKKTLDAPSRISTLASHSGEHIPILRNTRVLNDQVSEDNSLHGLLASIEPGSHEENANGATQNNDASALAPAVLEN